MEKRFLFCFMGGIVLPLLIGTFYALPLMDEFSNVNTVGAVLQNNMNLFMAVYMRTKQTYLCTTSWL